MPILPWGVEANLTTPPTGLITYRAVDHEMTWYRCWYLSWITERYDAGPLLDRPYVTEKQPPATRHLYGIQQFRRARTTGTEDCNLVMVARPAVNLACVKNTFADVGLMGRITIVYPVKPTCYLEIPPSDVGIKIGIVATMRSTRTTHRGSCWCVASSMNYSRLHDPQTFISEGFTELGCVAC